MIIIGLIQTKKYSEILCKLVADGESHSGRVVAPMLRAGKRAEEEFQAKFTGQTMILSQFCPSTPTHNPTVISGLCN